MLGEAASGVATGTGRRNSLNCLKKKMASTMTTMTAGRPNETSTRRRRDAGTAPGDWRRLESAVVPALRASRLRRALVSFGVPAAVVVVVLAIFFFKQFNEFRRPVPVASPEAAAPSTAASSPPAQPEPAPPATTDTRVPPAAGSTPAGAAAPGATTSPAGGPVRGEAGVILEVRASGRSWVRVTADGQTLFEDFVTAGETRRWQSRGPMTIRLGNAGFVEVTANGKTVGALGQSGEVVERTFTRDDAR